MENLNSYPPNESSKPWLLPVMGVALVIALGFSFYQGAQIQAMNEQLTTFRNNVAELRQGLTKVETQTDRQLTGLRGEMGEVRDDSEKIAKNAARIASWTAQSLAQKHADQLAAKLAEETEGSRKKLEEDLTAEISQVKSRAEQSSSQLTTVSTDVRSVRTDVDATKTELQKTIADLRRATGDMGVMSGLIATNASELKALRELGERNYYEFRLSRSEAQKVGDVMLALKKADPKKSRFTMELNAADRKIEKKDKTMNEPVQFYVASKARQPYEIVVNEISKDTVVGYLSTPKVQVSRK